MKKTALTSLVLATLFACTAPTIVKDPATIAADGAAVKERGADHLVYSVGIDIQAPPETVWAVLTDGSSWAQWNSTIISLEGDIALGETVKLVAKLDPDRTFKLKVSTFEAPSKMMWQDGAPFGMFAGRRTYTLEAIEGGTRFTMAEVMTGSMLEKIEPELPDFAQSFQQLAADLKAAAEAR